MCRSHYSVVIENYADDLVEEMDAVNNPEDSFGGKPQRFLFQRRSILKKMIFVKTRRKSFTGSLLVARCASVMLT